MKLMMIFGGMLGFVMGITLGLAQESSWPEVLWRASGGALAAGLLMRWWGGLWVRSLKEAHLDRMTKSIADAKKLATASKS